MVMFLKEVATHSKSLIFLLICTYVLLSPLGDLIRLSDVFFVSDMRLTSLIGMLIIILGFTSGSYAIGLAKYPFSIFFVAMVLICQISIAAYNLFPVGFHLSKDIYNLLYVFLLFVTVLGLEINKQQIVQIIVLFLGSLSISSFMSVLDYFSVVDFEFVNNNLSFTYILGAERSSMTGFFYSRTSLSMYLLLGFALISSLLTVLQNRRYLLCAWCCLGVLLISILLTYSRSLLISSVITITYIAWASGLFRNRMIRLLIFAGFSIVIFRLYNSTYNASDLVRVQSFIEVIKLIPESPIGNGTFWPYLQNIGRINPHNSYVYIFSISGIFGFVFFCLFAYPIIKLLVNKRSFTEETAFLSFIVGWGVYQLFHTAISFSSFWIFLGITLSYCYNYADERRRNNNSENQDVIVKLI